MTALLLTSLFVFFSPKGGCTGVIVKEIARAKTSVQLQAYSFTSEPIEKALEAAKARGVSVQVILDKAWPNEAPKVKAELATAGIPVLIDAKHAIAHNKVIVLDRARVITGSFNFTNQAEFQNAENVIVIRNATIAGKYADNFAVHAAHSAPAQ